MAGERITLDIKSSLSCVDVDINNGVRYSEACMSIDTIEDVHELKCPSWTSMVLKELEAYSDKSPQEAMLPYR
jgi:hypothetical protein